MFCKESKSSVESLPRFVSSDEDRIRASGEKVDRGHGLPPWESSAMSMPHLGLEIQQAVLAGRVTSERRVRAVAREASWQRQVDVLRRAQPPTRP